MLKIIVLVGLTFFLFAGFVLLAVWLIERVRRWRVADAERREQEVERSTRRLREMTEEANDVRDWQRRKASRR